MPTYDFRCPAQHVFERQAAMEETVVFCECGQPARRLPSIPYLKGSTVARNIPDPTYRWDAEKREHEKKGWDEDRAISTVRQSIYTDKEGRRFFDPKRADTAS